MDGMGRICTCLNLGVGVLGRGKDRGEWSGVGCRGVELGRVFGVEERGYTHID